MLAYAGAASARVERFALIVGNNQGLRHEVSLRYAESDARKLHDTLRDIGDFEPINITLLEGRDANALRRTLIALNDRVRSLRSRPDTQVVLLVYFSGHAAALQCYLLTMVDRERGKELRPALSARVGLGAGKRF